MTDYRQLIVHSLEHFTLCFIIQFDSSNIMVVDPVRDTTRSRRWLQSQLSHAYMVAVHNGACSIGIDWIELFRITDKSGMEAVAIVKTQPNDTYGIFQDVQFHYHIYRQDVGNTTSGACVMGVHYVDCIHRESYFRANTVDELKEQYLLLLVCVCIELHFRMRIMFISLLSQWEN